MSEGRLVKPQLRNLHLNRVKRQLGVMALVSLSVGLAYKVFVSDAYERKVEEFYKSYDEEAALKKMYDSGYMMSHVPDDAKPDK